MSNAVSILPRGSSMTRIAMAIAKAGASGLQGAAEYASARYGATSCPALALRSAVTVGTLSTDSPLGEYKVAANEFVAAIRPQTVLGRLSGARQAPLRCKIPRATSGLTVAWVGEAGVAPMSSAALDQITLANFKLCGIVAISDELAGFGSPSAEGLLRDDLIAAVVALSDDSLLDPANAGSNDKPASITYGSDEIVSAGTTAAAAKIDLRLLVAAVAENCNLIAPYLIMDKRTAVAMAVGLGDDVFFSKLTVNGGTLGGIPVIVSNSVATDGNSPGDSNIVLVDAAELIVGDEGNAFVDVTNETTLQFNSAPDSPETASTVQVSLWQNDLTAFRVTREINWQLRRSGAAGYISGVNYA